MKNLYLLIGSAVLFFSVNSSGANAEAPAAKNVSAETSGKMLTPSEELAAGVELARRGKYEDALQKYIWYHNNALKYDSTQSEKRLSLALSYWAELAQRYPRAKKELLKTRDTKIKLLMDGGGDSMMVMEVIAINKNLRENSLNLVFFRQLSAQRPDLAGESWNSIKEIAIRYKDRALLKKYLNNPYAEFGEIKKNYYQLQAEDEKNPIFKDAATKIFCERVCELILATAAIGQIDEAKKIKQDALVVVDSIAIRKTLYKHDQ